MSYFVTSKPASCEFLPLSPLPSASYLTYDVSKIYIDPSKITYQDLGTKTFTLKVDSPTSSDTTPGEQTLEIKFSSFYTTRHRNLTYRRQSSSLLFSRSKLASLTSNSSIRLLISLLIRYCRIFLSHAAVSFLTVFPLKKLFYRHIRPR